MQHTITSSITCSGIGIHSGKISNITFHSAEENTGIIFRRIDIKDKNNIVEAIYSNVHKTNLGTSLINDAGVEISTIEHLMAALWSLSIDNCIIDIDNNEIPILDGSSEPFIFLLKCAAIKKQNAQRKFVKVVKEIEVSKNNASLKAVPSDFFSIDFSINFSGTMISEQKYTFDSNTSLFSTDISRARTFCRMDEVEYMQRNGLALGGSLENAVVVDNDKILNERGLRYNNEFVRHKILDLVGDLYLTSKPIIAKFIAIKSGHELNNNLIRKIFSDPKNYVII